MFKITFPGNKKVDAEFKGFTIHTDQRAKMGEMALLHLLSKLSWHPSGLVQVFMYSAFARAEDWILKELKLFKDRFTIRLRVKSVKSSSKSRFRQLSLKDTIRLWLILPIYALSKKWSRIHPNSRHIQ